MKLNISGNARLRHFKKDSFPSPSAMQLDCGKCGCREYEVYVEPRQDDARVIGVVCKECRDVFRVDLAGFLDAKGQARRVDLSETAEV